MNDHYKTLGIDKNASPDDIKKAYRKLAGKHHPDKGGDTAKFQQVEEAYRTLSDPTTKQQYDNPNPFGQGAQPHGFHFNMQNGMFNFEEVFGHMFRGQPNNRQSFQQTYRTTVYVTLEQSYSGGVQNLKLQTPTDSYIINIQIPKGINNGGQMRYDNIVPNANLIVEFRVQEHLKYDRKGDDLYYTHSISVLDLIVGTTIKFTTLSGKELEVKIPPKTQPTTQMRIPAEGMPISGSNSYGDQIILLRAIIPDIIDDEITQSILRSKSR